MRGAADTAIDIARLEQILERACGVTLSAGLRRALKGSFARAAEAAGKSPGAFSAQLESGDPEALSCLVEHSVVGETYFFRHPEHFEALRRYLVSAGAPRGPLRVWSAGCATGEEPYSLAMALLQLGRAGDRILATDVSERALRTARQASYRAWSMRRLPKEIRARFFEPEGEALKVVAPARAMVEFRRHNLVGEPPPIAACDLVVCRNVLIYFAPETIAKVLHELARALKPGGLLVLGPVELPHASVLAMEWIDAEEATILRKPSGLAKARRGAARPEAPRRASPRRPDARASPRPAPPAAAPGPAAPSTPAENALFARARAAARRGELAEAEALARECASKDLSPEAYLLLSMAAEARGGLPEAVDALRRALYLEPGLASAHAALVPLFTRLGRREEAERARRNALRALEGLDDAALLRGVETLTAGALRRALERPEGARVASH